jgi:hypothetical protein
MTITITPDTITNTITGILFLSASLWFVALAMKYIFEIVGSITTIISKMKNRGQRAEQIGTYRPESPDEVFKIEGTIWD